MDAIKDNIKTLFAWLCFLTVFLGPFVALCYLLEIQEEKSIEKLASLINSRTCRCESTNK
jgi:hypothetical protein